MKKFDMSVLRSTIMAAEMMMRENKVPIETVGVELVDNGIKLTYATFKDGKLGEGSITGLDLDHMPDAVRFTPQEA